MNLEKPISELRRDMLQHMGIVSFQEQDRLIDVARRCATTSGIALGGGWMILGSVVPGYGTLAGFLAGWVAGTASCMVVNQSVKSQLQDLVRDHLH